MKRQCQQTLSAYRSVSAIKNKKFAIVEIVEIVKKVEMVSAWFRMALELAEMVVKKNRPAGAQTDIKLSYNPATFYKQAEITQTNHAQTTKIKARTHSESIRRDFCIPHHASCRRNATQRIFLE